MSGVGAGGGRLGWVRVTAGRAPVRWITAGAALIVLAATAAFGGLATAAEPPISSIAPGDVHRSDQLVIQITDATLHDADDEEEIYVDPGERMLIVRMTLENLHVRPQYAGTRSDVTDAVRIAELSEIEDDILDSRVVRADDGTLSPTLQPNVPVDVEFRYTVPDDLFDDGDVLHVTLNDLSLHIGQFVTSGEWWDDPTPAATMDLPITYVPTPPSQDDEDAS